MSFGNALDDFKNHIMTPSIDGKIEENEMLIKATS